MATKGRIDMLVRFSCLLLLLTGNSYSQRDKLLQADEIKDGDELLSAFGKFIAAGVVLLTIHLEQNASYKLGYVGSWHDGNNNLTDMATFQTQQRSIEGLLLISL
ncbi:hypothetical protein EZV62_004015 [Acer yangbiense]|uniref:Uncharacterized protein n=1 Tax=Acer yangbiense TaxID=1000413 RepID=A0A5C7IIH5_9ROSI|nr:hypothetical protein EZV62_004015 [Acer yangbiense]